MLLGLAQVVLIVTQTQQSAVDLGVEGLYAPVHHLRRARVLVDGGHIDARLGDSPKRAAGGEQLHSSLSEVLGQFCDSRLVIGAHKRHTDLAHSRVPSR